MMRLVVVLSLLVIFASSSFASVSSLVDNGNDAFNDGEYSKALEYYHEAEIEQPETPEIYYNQANALLKNGKYEDAIAKYDKALNTLDINLQANAYFNQGNGYFLQGDYAKAIGGYENVLEIYPEDRDAKFNLELARNRLKEQMERQPKDQDQQGEPSENSEKQEQQKQDEQQQQDQESQQQENKPEGDEGDKPPEEQAKQAEEPPKDEMSKEDANRILQALEDDEKENQKNKKKIKVSSNYRGKGW